MANRALIKSWQPQLQTIYLEEVALMQHRVFGAEHYLPSVVQIAQHRFNEACATLLKQMADHVDGNAPDRWAEIRPWPSFRAGFRRLLQATPDSSRREGWSSCPGAYAILSRSWKRRSADRT